MITHHQSWTWILEILFESKEYSRKLRRYLWWLTFRNFNHQPDKAYGCPHSCKTSSCWDKICKPWRRWWRAIPLWDTFQFFYDCLPFFDPSCSFHQYVQDSPRRRLGYTRSALQVCETEFSRCLHLPFWKVFFFFDSVTCHERMNQQLKMLEETFENWFQSSLHAPSKDWKVFFFCVT